MSSVTLGIGLVVAGAAIESAAQLCLKLAATPTAGSAPRAWLALGIGAYAVEVLLYTAALRWVDVGVAFPLGSLSFVGVALLARVFLGEAVSAKRLFGVGCIVLGAVLVTR